MLMQQEDKERHPDEGLMHRFSNLNHLWDVVFLKGQLPHHDPSLSEAFCYRRSPEEFKFKDGKMEVGLPAWDRANTLYASG